MASEETEEIWFEAYACVNDRVEHCPAIGQAPPKRFRQADRFTAGLAVLVPHGIVA